MQLASARPGPQPGGAAEWLRRRLWGGSQSGGLHSCRLTKRDEDRQRQMEGGGGVIGGRSRQHPANEVAQCRKAGDKVKSPRFGGVRGAWGAALWPGQKPQMAPLSGLHCLPTTQNLGLRCVGLPGDCQPAAQRGRRRVCRGLRPAPFSAWFRKHWTTAPHHEHLADPTAWNRPLGEIDAILPWEPRLDRRATKSTQDLSVAGTRTQEALKRHGPRRRANTVRLCFTTATCLESWRHD